MSCTVQKYNVLYFLRSPWLVWYRQVKLIDHLTFWNGRCSQQYLHYLGWELIQDQKMTDKTPSKIINFFVFNTTLGQTEGTVSYSLSWALLSWYHYYRLLQIIWAFPCESSAPRMNLMMFIIWKWLLVFINVIRWSWRYRIPLQLLF